MDELVPVLKDETQEVPVPSTWRPTFHAIVEAFKKGDFALARAVAGVLPISAEDAARIARNIENYGDCLVSLPEQTWDTSGLPVANAILGRIGGLVYGGSRRRRSCLACARV